MVAQFGMYGSQPQLVAKNTLLAGQTLTGHKFTVSELVYNGPAWLGAQTNKSYAVDVFGTTDTPQAYGFTERAEAERFIHSTKAEDYTAHDIHGNGGKVSRVGLGVPEGMVSRMDGSAAPSLARALDALALAQRAMADRGPNPLAGVAPDDPTVRASSNPAGPAPWPVVNTPMAAAPTLPPDRGPQATGVGTQEQTDATGPLPVGKPGDAVPDAPGAPLAPGEATTDGSNATRPGDAATVPQSTETGGATPDTPSASEKSGNKKG